MSAKRYTLIIEGQPRKNDELAFAYFCRGRARNLQQRTDEAIVDLTSAIAVDPRLAEAHSELGRAYAHLRRFDQAIVETSEAVRLDPKNFMYRYFQEGQPDEALVDYNEAIRLDPSAALPHMNRGIVLAGKGLMNEALSNLNDAVRLDPNNSDMYFNRGFFYRQTGRLDRAVSHFTEAIRLNPEAIEAYNGAVAGVGCVSSAAAALIDDAFNEPHWWNGPTASARST